MYSATNELFNCYQRYDMVWNGDLRDSESDLAPFSRLLNFQGSSEHAGELSPVFGSDVVWRIGNASFHCDRRSYLDSG